MFYASILFALSLIIAGFTIANPLKKVTVGYIVITILTKKDFYMDQRKEIFDKIKVLMKKYENSLVARSDFDSRYELWSEKKIEVAGKKRKDIFFAGLIIQSNYVGFYFMPIYTDTKLKDVFEPELLATLKGKSCFHIKKLDKKLISQIKKSLETGFKLYKNREWV